MGAMKRPGIEIIIVVDIALIGLGSRPFPHLSLTETGSPAKLPNLRCEMPAIGTPYPAWIPVISGSFYEIPIQDFFNHLPPLFTHRGGLRIDLLYSTESCLISD